MRSIRCLIFILTAAFISHINAESTLFLQNGQKAHIRIEFNSKVRLTSLFGNGEEASQDAVELNITLLDDGTRDCPIQIEAVITGYQTTDDEMPYAMEQIIGKPLQFAVSGNYKAIETSGLFEELSDPEDALKLKDFFNYILGQMFHIAHCPFELESQIAVPAIDWVDIMDEPISRTENEIRDDSAYKITRMDEKKIAAEWKANASYRGTDGEGSVEIAGNIEWNSENPLVQQRKVLIKIQQFCGFGIIHLDIDQTWTAVPLD